MTHPVVRAIFKRDLRAWFGNPTGYVFITLFVFLSAFALIGPVQFFQNNLANLDTLNQWYRVLLLFFVPAVTMGIWAAERSHGTDELLFTLPATDGQILLGKYLAAAGVYTIALLFTFSLPLGLSLLGNPDFGLILTNYIGYWLLGLMLISCAMLGSQLTDNLTVSFILGALFCAIVVFSEDIVAGLFPALGRTWSLYGPNAQFEELGRGVLSLSSILMFGGLTAAFLYLNLALISRRTWIAGSAEGLHRGLRFAALLVAAVSLAVFGLNQLPRMDGTSESIHSLSEGHGEAARRTRRGPAGLHPGLRLRRGAARVRPDAPHAAQPAARVRRPGRQPPCRSTSCRPSATPTRRAKPRPTSRSGTAPS